MRLANWTKNAVVIVAMCALLGVPALAQQGQQSSSQQQTGDAVADAARKAQEQKKTAPKPKKVYTEDDIPPRLADAAATAATSGGATIPGQAAGSDQAAVKVQGAAVTANKGDKDKKEDPETTWRKRFADQREKLATAELELSVLQRESEKAQVQYYSDPQKALQEQNSRKDINDKNAKIEEKKRQIAALTQQLSDMEDELRKSGGDPGWAH